MVAVQDNIFQRVADIMNPRKWGSYLWVGATGGVEHDLMLKGEYKWAFKTKSKEKCEC